MSTAVAAQDRAGQDPVPDGGRRPAAERGELTIADRVVERIVEAAVAEAGSVTGAPPSMFGQPLWAVTEGSKARVSASVDGGVVTAKVRLSVRWPEPVLAATRRVRTRIVDRVVTMTGLRVAEIDVEVSGLYSPTRRRVR
ncbi:MAG TPA: Asp23/Gls24 family envelope stress response protein [Mycobacteriales bacterium]|jgi:uncharacterized alkaline shock family protein YloU|nr:Asp23/Gls24 family envelope stress response protein [Mycobacteriales bacterium]